MLPPQNGNPGTSATHKWAGIILAGSAILLGRIILVGWAILVGRVSLLGYIILPGCIILVVWVILVGRAILSGWVIYFLGSVYLLDRHGYSVWGELVFLLNYTPYRVRSE